MLEMMGVALDMRHFSGCYWYGFGHETFVWVLSDSWVVGLTEKVSTKIKDFLITSLRIS